MSKDVHSHIDEAIALLRAGKVQEADDLLSAIPTAAAAAGAEPAAPVAPPEPRAINAILYDFAVLLSDLMGNPPSMQSLIKEYEAAIAAKV